MNVKKFKVKVPSLSVKGRIMDLITSVKGATKENEKFLWKV